MPTPESSRSTKIQDSSRALVYVLDELYAVTWTDAQLFEKLSAEIIGLEAQKLEITPEELEEEIDTIYLRRNNSDL